MGSNIKHSRDVENKELALYRTRRNPATTPEPMGGAATRGRRFVVQHHLARREHYDLRLEHDGVLLCWAVPKGPSADPADKRLAVQTEPHPIRYTAFEGVIPEGNYGAGVMIVWDQGHYVPDIDMDAGLEAGKLLFTLYGYKLNGTWTLVRTRQDWLLIKERDAYVRTGSDNLFAQDSVLSGLTAEERRKPEIAVRRLRRRLGRSKALPLSGPMKTPAPMLAVRHPPFSNKDWVFELKHDGYRALAVRQGERVDLVSRNAHSLTDAFPDLTYPLSHLPCTTFVLDGEIVCLDSEGRSVFSRLQGRASLETEPERLKAAISTPATYFAFDILQALDYDCRKLPLLERKAILASLLPSAGAIRYNDHLEARGETLYQYAIDRGLEGMVAKRADSPYVSGRSALWRKTALDSTDDFVVAGWVPSDSVSRDITALLLARYVQGELVYAGRVGTGLSAEVEAELLAAFARLPPGAPPREAPVAREDQWVAPALVVEVRYRQRTENGLLRMPVLLRLRPDKAPHECGDGNLSTGATEPTREISVTNPQKVLWPDADYTKSDLVRYYRAVAPYLLPYLEDRPVTLLRYPDGIDGEAFFQKNAPAGTPEWLRVETVMSSDGETKDYLVLESEDALAWVANLAAIELHVRAATVTAPDRPTWFVIDLDPKDAPFAWVVEAARAILAICAAIDLPAYAKTSGSTGMHVLFPGGGLLDHEQGTLLATLIARVVEQRLPQMTTLERRIDRRGGKVYLDCGQNRAGQTIAAPFSVRARPGAPVSMPIRASELTRKDLIARFNLKSTPRRLAQLVNDPLLPLLSDVPDFAQVLEKLGAAVEKGTPGLPH